MTISEYQFDSPDADVILLTTEVDCSTEFHVHKCILAAASPFFHDMFSLPQGDDELVKRNVPIIPVSESSKALDTVLRFVYPVSPPTFDTLDDLTAALAVAIKYEFASVILTLRRSLVSPRFLQTSPIRVYALACQHEFEEEAKIASRSTLGVSLLDAKPVTELRYMTGYDYHRLLQLHRWRTDALLQLLPEIPENLKCMQCNGSAFTMDDAPRWWGEWVKRAREEVKARPTTDVVFGLDFLFGAAQRAGCTRCPGSVLDSWRFLKSLKEDMDRVPGCVGEDILC